MEWQKLLSSKRLGGETDLVTEGRSPFQKDFDRIVFSAAFRRLQDKTQVFPLPESDFVRTRLTHSLEVSCVGRSLGTRIGEKIIDKYKLHNITAADVGMIVASACLAHDIGNPPFGHSGEDAIQHWFKESKILDDRSINFPESKRQDLLRFEGNAQGFRILTCLQNPNNKGGLQLTSATLGTFTKYPRESDVMADMSSAGISAKKFGFFQSEKKWFEEVASNVGLIRRSATAAWWARHPLAFLVEAADDICYHLTDFEDGFRLNYVSYAEAENLLCKIAHTDHVRKKLQQIETEKEKIEYLRAIAISFLISDVVNVFMDNEENILKGEFDIELTSLITCRDTLKSIKDLSKKKVYGARTVLELEAAGFEVIGGLLTAFITALDDVVLRGEKALPKNKKYAQLIPDRCRANDKYDRFLRITDFISGMTDSFAVLNYKNIKGISLPDM